MGVEASVNRTAFSIAHPKKTLLQQLHICDKDVSVERSIYSAAQMDALPIEWAMASAGLAPTQPAPQEWKASPASNFLLMPNGGAYVHSLGGYSTLTP